MQKKLVFHKGQKSVYRFINNVHNPAIFAAMRFGKCLLTVRKLKTDRRIKSVLIVTKYEAFNGWIETLQMENITYTLLQGTKKQRQEALHAYTGSKLHFYIINWQGWMVLPEIKSFEFDCVCLDESIHIANPKSKVSKFFVKNFRRVYKKIILTGDPVPNHTLEYYQQLTFLDTNILPFVNYWDFRARCFVPDHTGHNFKITKKGKEILNNCLFKNAIFISRKECGFENEKIYQKRYITFPPGIQKQYNTIVDEFILEYDNTVYKKSIYAIQAYIWLRRLCGGFFDKQFMWGGKIKELLYLLQNDLSNQHIIIWASFTKEQYKIQEAIKKAMNIDAVIINGTTPKNISAENIKLFQNDKMQFLIAQPSCLKHGVDLSNADTEIYYSQCNGADTRNQSEDRLVHKNRKQSILIIDLLITNSIEIDYRESHINKENKKQLDKRIIKRMQNAI